MYSQPWSLSYRLVLYFVTVGCAIIEITGGGEGFSAPKLSTACVFGDSDCVTVEGDEFVYPNPGNVVTFGGKWSSGTPGETQYKGTCELDLSCELIMSWADR